LNRLEATLLDVVARLDELQVGCALVGGLAVSARAEPRFTRDVDLAVVAGADRAAEAVVGRFLTAGFGVPPRAAGRGAWRPVLGADSIVTRAAAQAHVTASDSGYASRLLGHACS
jgi:hypothetical protein